jgi:hypothetical protein
MEPQLKIFLNTHKKMSHHEGDSAETRRYLSIPSTSVTELLRIAYKMSLYKIF